MSGIARGDGSVYQDWKIRDFLLLFCSGEIKQIDIRSQKAAQLINLSKYLVPQPQFKA